MFAGKTSHLAKASSASLRRVLTQTSTKYFATMATKMRIEKDALGEVSVPSDRLWGAQTERSRQNFKIATNERMPTEVVRSMGIVKLAAARVNHKNGLLNDTLFNAMETAAKEVIDGVHDSEFPLVVWQTGSGTQTNMNTNEVVANRAIQILGGEVGTKKPVHPNDHVNMGQSSNDTFPTAMHISAAVQTTQKLIPALKSLATAFERCSSDFMGIIKIGRTHLQDATPLLLGQEFSAFEAAMRFGLKRVENALAGVYALAQGGTAVGTGLNAYEGFAEQFAEEVARITGIPQFCTAENKFHSLAAVSALVDLSGAIALVASDLHKIANDIRLLGSGPRCGLGEIQLPENEPGSSIMPGKINPTQCEAVTMVTVEIMANHNAVLMSNATGQLQLNVMRPVVILNVLRSIRLLADAADSFRKNCVVGIKPNAATIKHNLDNSLMLVTALNRKIGYDNCAKVALNAHQKGLSLKESCLELNLLTSEEFDQYVKPEEMLGPKKLDSLPGKENTQ